ncbi:MAG: aquaporin [Alphaproteobacteria bacterium]|nr:aquaporin [Alphaproteobacteria bacterium]
MNTKALLAECLGTFAYVAVICGAALLGASRGIDGLEAALAAGLTYAAMCYALGGVSACHFNPALTLGLVAAGRFETRNAVPYVIAQVLGALGAAACFAGLAATSGDGQVAAISTIANRFEAGGTFPFAAVLVGELMAMALILILFVGATTSGVPAGFMPIAMAFLIAGLHFVLAPISHAALNPARASAVAAFSDTEALLQLWVFWVAPILGAVGGGLIASWLNND